MAHLRRISCHLRTPLNYDLTLRAWSMKKRSFRLPSAMPLKVALSYLAITAVWIVGSDHAVNLISSDPAVITALQTWKGSFFIVTSALLLYLVLRHYVHRMADDARRLGESEERFENAFRHSSIPHAITRLHDDRIVAVNQAMAELLGRNPEELVGQSVLALNLWSDPDRERAEVLALMRGQKVISGVEIRIRHSSGTVHEVILSGQVISIGNVDRKSVV